MANFGDTSVIGVDGGGTNCRFAMQQRDRRIEILMEAANVSSDRSGALEVLQRGLSALTREAGLTPEAARKIPAYLGLAGMVDPEVAHWIARALPFVRVRIEDDRRAAMVGALGANEGCVIGIGTGSFFGRRCNGHDRLAGGWGFALADEASGAALGRDLLRAALASHDAVGETSEITRATLAEFGSPSAIVAFATSAMPKDFAKFAPQIVTAASKGDPVAIRLMVAGASEIEATLRALGWSEAETIHPVGGLAPHYRPYLSPDLAAQLQTPAGSALDGALALAREFASEGELA